MFRDLWNHGPGFHQRNYDLTILTMLRNYATFLYQIIGQNRSSLSDDRSRCSGYAYGYVKENCVIKFPEGENTQRRIILMKENYK